MTNNMSTDKVFCTLVGGSMHELWCNSTISQIILTIWLWQMRWWVVDQPIPLFKPKGGLGSELGSIIHFPPTTKPNTPKWNKVSRSEASIYTLSLSSSSCEWQAHRSMITNWCNRWRKTSFSHQKLQDCYLIFRFRVLHFSWSALFLSHLIWIAVDRHRVPTKWLQEQ